MEIEKMGNFAKVTNRKSKRFFLMNIDDLYILSEFIWVIRDDGYVYRKENNRNIYLHREIIKTKKGMVTDHINGNSSDNRRENLRECTISENAQNRGKQKNNKSGEKGVVFDKKINKFRAYINKDKKHKFLGYFSTAEEAGKAYKKASIIIHGEYAKQ